MRCAPLAELHPFIDAIAREAGGRMSGEPVSANRMLALQAAAAKGDPDAARLVAPVLSAIAEVRNAPPFRRPYCMICDWTIKANDRYCVGVICAAVAASQIALTFLVCHRCCPSQETFDVAAELIVRHHWSEARDFRLTGRGRTSTGDGAA